MIFNEIYISKKYKKKLDKFSNSSKVDFNKLNSLDFDLLYEVKNNKNILLLPTLNNHFIYKVDKKLRVLYKIENESLFLMDIITPDDYSKI